ncbi:MAG: hypothetical protein L3K00_01085 [Thermoplasmata archaeon]|nr:hypothetical protein [Thermoplasmata archaeon]
MPRSPRMRLPLLVLLSVTLAAAVAFLAAILGLSGTGLDVHELAGTVLLVLLLPATLLAVSLRRSNPRPLPRVLAALGALVAAGVLGALLASGRLSGSAAGAPLLPLLLVLVAVADGVRVTWSGPRPSREGVEAASSVVRPGPPRSSDIPAPRSTGSESTERWQN